MKYQHYLCVIMTEIQKEKKVGPLAGFFSVIAVALIKFKAFIFAGIKFLPLILKGSFSLFLSLGLYAMMFGWRYAVMIIVLIYVHEMGHYIWMKFYGLNPKAPVFVPFLGAYTAMSNLPDNPVTHAWVAYAGPLVGGLGAALFYWIGMQTNNLFLVAAANTGFMLNMFQLVPMRPFDGGFISSCISKWLSIPGLLLAVWLAWQFHSILIFIICIVGFFATLSQFKKAETVPVPVLQKIIVTLAYFGLAGTLAWCFGTSQMHLSTHMISRH